MILKILFIGDIVSKLGREVLAKSLSTIVKKHNIDLVIANCENATGGRGISIEHYKYLKNLGIHAFTSGEHIFKVPKTEKYINDLDIAIPINLPNIYIGKRFLDINIKNTQIRVISLLGSVFMKQEVFNPFTTIEKFLNKDFNKDKIILIDFHAEATSEKQALKYFLAGKVSAIVGTHTHVQTNDPQIVKGTAYITDLGMTGSTNSVIGVKSNIIINRFYKADSSPFEWEKNGDSKINGVVISIDTKTKLASNISIL